MLLWYLTWCRLDNTVYLTFWRWFDFICLVCNVSCFQKRHLLSLFVCLFIISVEDKWNLNAALLQKCTSVKLLHKWQLLQTLDLTSHISVDDRKGNGTQKHFLFFLNESWQLNFPRVKEKAKIISSERGSELCSVKSNDFFLPDSTVMLMVRFLLRTEVSIVVLAMQVYCPSSAAVTFFSVSLGEGRIQSLP